jgi:hypothetical protein
MQGIGRVLTCSGAASVGIGLFALLDAYWRWIGVALGYPPLLPGLVGSGLLLVGIGCLLAGRQATPRGGRAPDRVLDAMEAEHDERA